MKSYPRIRKTVKWGGLVVCVLLVAAWAWGMFWPCCCPCGESLEFFVRPGGCTVRYEQYENLPWGMRDSGVRRARRAVFMAFYEERAPQLWIPDVRTWSDGFFVSIPLWPLIVASMFATAFAWRLDARAGLAERVNLCTKCGYDRAGLAPGAVCPECGTTPTGG